MGVLQNVFIIDSYTTTVSKYRKDLKTMTFTKSPDNEPTLYVKALLPTQELILAGNKANLLYNISEALSWWSTSNWQIL